MGSKCKRGGHLDLKGQHYHQVRGFVVWEILSHSFGKVAGRFSWHQALWEPPPQHPMAGETLQEPRPQHLRLQSPSAAPQAQELRWGTLGASLPIPGAMTGTGLAAEMPWGSCHLGQSGSRHFVPDTGPPSRATQHSCSPSPDWEGAWHPPGVKRVWSQRVPRLPELQPRHVPFPKQPTTTPTPVPVPMWDKWYLLCWGSGAWASPRAPWACPPPAPPSGPSLQAGTRWSCALPSGSPGRWCSWCPWHLLSSSCPGHCPHSAPHTLPSCSSTPRAGLPRCWTAAAGAGSVPAGSPGGGSHPGPRCLWGSAPAPCLACQGERPPWCWAHSCRGSR